MFILVALLSAAFAASSAASTTPPPTPSLSDDFDLGVIEPVEAH